MKVIIQQVDMDTCLTALILGVSPDDEIIVVRDQADPEDLNDPCVLCIECGGSGRVELNNFDHHDAAHAQAGDLPPACRQAFDHCFLQDPDRWATRNPEKWGRMMSPLEFHLAARLFPDRPSDYERRVAVQREIERLVDYVALLDTRGPEALISRSGLPKGAFPTLSDVFSGMRLSIRDPGEQLIKGMEILRLVLEEGLDPFGLMPELPEWQGYLEAKRRNDAELERAKAHAKLFTTKGGLKGGYLETEFFGALGVLYELGCQVAIAYNPRFGDPPVKKYTIGGNGVKVDSLLSILTSKEPGWGGPAHGTIIGSPREGSRLQPEEVIKLVKEHL